MAKKQKADVEQKPAPAYTPKKTEVASPVPPGLPPLPPEVEEKLKVLKEKTDRFKKVLVEKFDKYIVGIALLPPPQQPQPGMSSPPPIREELDADGKPLPPPDPNAIHLLVLIDDTEPSKMSKLELRDKIVAIMDQVAKEIDPKLAPQPLLLSEVWQNCYDAKYDLLGLIAMSAPIHDTGMLAAIRIAEIHKRRVLERFEKYIVAYVLAGSLVQGKATPESDIDVFVVIDDTDVKKMTRAELKDKLRAIIIGEGIRVGEETGVRNKINIQVYILTDFWESIREANPVIFTFLRDGVPFHDRGIVMPWKQLLKMGKIRPSIEAIDLYMSSGEQMIDRVKFKLRDIGMEDIFYALLNPSQAAIMNYGVPPPTPKETPTMMRQIFVDKEKLMTNEEVDILQEVIQVRKDLEHGTKKDVSGKELDDLLEKADKYLKRIKRLFTQIEKVKEEENMLHVYDAVVTAARDVLRLEGVERADNTEILHTFEEELISTGKIPANFLRTLHTVIKAHDDHAKGKLSRTEIDGVRKDAGELIKHLVEYVQRKRAHDLERARIRVKHGDKYGEITMLGSNAYIVRDIEASTRVIEKAATRQDGTIDLEGITTIQPEEYEHALVNVKPADRIFIRQPVFDDLRKLFGKDVELLVGG